MVLELIESGFDRGTCIAAAVVVLVGGSAFMVAAGKKLQARHLFQAAMNRGQPQNGQQKQCKRLCEVAHHESKIDQ